MQTVESLSRQRRRRQASRPGPAEAALQWQVSGPPWIVWPTPCQARQRLPTRMLQNRALQLSKRQVGPMQLQQAEMQNRRGSPRQLLEMMKVSMLLELHLSRRYTCFITPKCSYNTSWDL